MLSDPPSENIEARVVQGPSRLFYALAALAVIGVGVLWLGSDPTEMPQPVPPASTDPASTLERDGVEETASAAAVVPLAGWFPDGSDYVLHRRGAHTESVTTVLVTIGTVAAGTTEATPRYLVTLAGSGDRATMADWSLGLASLEGEGDLIGIEAGELLDRLNLAVIDGFPRLEPRPPLVLLPGRGEIRYETFSVFDQCRYLDGEVCSDTGAVGVSIEGSDDTTAITSQTARRLTDPHYFDPGPLTPRRSHRVWWSGRELLVFGGAELAEPESFQPGSVLPDGAAFDPATDTWRPLTPEEIARANDGADDDAAAWASPASAIGGEGFAPEGAPGRVHPRYTVWTGSEFLAWGVPCCGGADDPVGGFDTWRWSGSDL